MDKLEFDFNKWFDNFWSEVFFLMQPQNCRLKVYKRDGFRLARFWMVSDDGGSFVKLNKEIRVYGDGTVDVPADRALRDPYVWVLAWRLGYLRFPKTWKRISRWFRHKFGDFCIKRKDGDVALYFRDSFGNHCLVHGEIFRDREVMGYVNTVLNKNSGDFL